MNAAGRRPEDRELVGDLQAAGAKAVKGGGASARGAR
jgi:hypothetical protein